MKRRVLKKTGCQTVSLPCRLVEEVAAVAPPELWGNLSRLVTVALEDFARLERARAFEKAMAAMAADPAIQAECAVISTEFSDLPEAD